MNIRIIICIVLTFCLCLSVAASAEVVFIVNKSFSGKTLKQGTLKNIYLGRKTQWENGEKIYPAMLKAGQIHREFAQNIVGVSTVKLKKIWKEALFTGKGTPPKVFKTEEDLVKFVAATKGAVGYIDSSTPYEKDTVITIK